MTFESTMLVNLKERDEQKKWCVLDEEGRFNGRVDVYIGSRTL